MPVFTPHRSAVAGCPAGKRVILARVLPGQDLQATARQLCVEHGWKQASMRASIGSLVGPTFLRAGYEATLPAPCAELVTLIGQVSADAALDTSVQVLVGDSGGAVHGGTIDPARSPVAVTVELFLIEDGP
ncbi:PCC domain-containing protein [Pseudonocardia parietis]|uniref:DNA-binding protein with PD1-like motif n=1 Tax=Pseudonocardia parietis TaxID=570936 RepID=A0ABS4W8W8_9PSEU|nr:DUF296 domain-containing protein [Pseudonocardia parietis]MBP2372069.1 putative DNA-binding protein with PD1-like motif [Pseudonocardia parietis]